MLLGALLCFCLTGCGGEGDEGDGGSVEGSGSEGGGEQDGRELPCTVCEDGEYVRAVTKAAGALTEGTALYTCGSCGNSYSEVIPATKSIKLLIVGDASGSDAIKLLEPVLTSVGIEDIVIHQLNYASKYSAGVTLDDQWSNIEGSRPVYTVSYYENGSSNKEYTQTFQSGLLAKEWDYIVLQQRIGLAGDEESYSHLGDILGFIEENKTNPAAKVLWNMTWAFNSGSGEGDFAGYGEDQLTMYRAIADTVKAKVLADSRIDGIIPLGTAIQNLRGVCAGLELVGDGIRLDNNGDSFALYASALTFCRALTGAEPESVEWTPETESSYDRNIFALTKEAVRNAFMNNYEINSPVAKTIRILIFGNSYGNDATRYLEELLREGGYVNVIIGHVGESSMAINDHYHNIDDDPDNDYIYTTSKGDQYTFSVHYKTVNGEKVELEADYKRIVADEPWDYLIFYQGPNGPATLTQASYYSELGNLVTALKTYMTNPEGKIVYYMPWAHNVADTAELYNGIVDITEELILTNENIDGIIPAATLIQNLRTSYLKDGAAGDITRDWGHLNYGVGRYALGLLFYSYLTGGNIDGITYIPTADDVSVGERPLFTDPGENIEVIREAVKNALATPFEVTESVYKEKP